MLSRALRSPLRSVASLAAAVAVLVGSALVAPEPIAQAAQPTTLRTALATQISTLNPFLAYFDGELDIFGAVYPTLDALDSNNKPTPYLADSWTVSADKLTWTFKIHRGLKWSDGQPLTAKDAAWTFNLIMTNKVAATANGALVSNFAKVEAPDATTLRITTKTPQANMLYISVPISGIHIVPEHIWAAKVSGLRDFKNLNFPLVGHGPYRLTGYQTDQFATLEVTKDFFLGRAKYDKVIVQYFKNSDAAVAALRSGQVDQTGGLTSTQYQALSKVKGVQAYQQAAVGWTALDINPGARTASGTPLGDGNPALRDPKVRAAIVWAINRDELVKRVLLGLGVAGQAYLPPAYPQWKWQPSADERVGFDPGKANRILDDAGYTRGSDGVRVDPKTHRRLSFRLGWDGSSTNNTQDANYIVGWLKGIGIKVTTQVVSMATLNDDAVKGNWDLLIGGWSTGADPTYLLSIQTCGALPENGASTGISDVFYCDPAYDKLYAQQQAQFDQSQRAETIAKMQQMIYQANDDVMLYYPNLLGAVRTDRVAGFVSGSENAQGYYPAQSLWIALRAAHPVGSGSAKSGGSATGIVIGGIGCVIVLIAVAVFLLRRRATAGERE